MIFFFYAFMRRNDLRLIHDGTEAKILRYDCEGVKNHLTLGFLAFESRGSNGETGRCGGAAVHVSHVLDVMSLPTYLTTTGLYL